MKKGLNLFVLTAFLTTTMPIHTVYAQNDSEQVTEQVEEAEQIEIPAEAIAESEQLIKANQELQNNNDEEKGPTCIKSGVAYSPRMSKEQRKELFVKGQITDCEGNIWNIKVIPGSDYSKQMTIKSWHYAGKHAKQMFKIETYKKAGKDGKKAAKASFDFTKKSSKLLKKGVWDYMIVEGIYNDLIKDTARVWKNAGVTVSKLRGSFGWLFGAIYAGVLKPVTLTGVNVIKAAYHITAGTVILVGGIAGTAGGLIATISSPIIVPVVEVMTHPLLAVGSILTTGSIVPGVVYVWNGTAWVSTQLSHVPDSETKIGGVRFVKLENPKAPVREQVEVTMADLGNVVEAGIKNSVRVTKNNELKAQRKEIQDQINALQQQMNEVYRQESEVESQYRNDASVKAVTALSQKRWNSDIILSADVANSLDDEKIRGMVVNSANELGISLSEVEIENAVKEIKKHMVNIQSK